jgi:energy-coupling factor transporter ATP-binding protein EcfA2
MSTEVKSIELPTATIKSVVKSPKNLIIFSKPKTGKTTLLAQLPNCLLIDLEGGSDYVDAMKIKANNIKELMDIETAIIKAGKPYKYIALDTITALEDMCIPYAEHLYSLSPMGASWKTTGKAKYGNILNLANGAGYPWLRQAFNDITARIKNLAPNVIFCGHVKDTLLSKNGNDFSSLDLNLTGKLKDITTSKSDAIGYLVRVGDKNILSFKTQDDISCGARPEHLRNKEIVISETLEDGTIVTHWDQVFID